jgi:hypothetical protein
MALIAGIFIIAAILALFGALAQRWGADSREDFVDSYIPRVGMR